MGELGDEKLFESFRAGDQQAYTRLVHRYEKEIYNFLLRFLGSSALAEDVFQETFLQIYLSADSFQSGRSFRPWLYTIAANKARDALRSRARRPTVQLTTGDDQAELGRLWDTLNAEVTTPEQIYSQKQLQQLVRKVADQLPDHLREILILSYFDQLSYKELSEVLGIPLGTVKSRLHSAVKNFAKLYSEQTLDSDRNEK
ncbi:MAG: sigma-70 family RNA polymerase sigma factor [Sedimentisphaerales bacterium]|nr:sigma-70 family RNA polymerase sigma factor [Sedimentisphaerales bacterium]